MSESSLADKAGGHIGGKFLNLYDGFFSNEEFTNELIRFSNKYTPSEGITVLELGANNGIISSAYKSKSPDNEYIISDFNGEALMESTCIDNKVQCDNKSLPFGDNTIDTIIMRSVLHYEKTEQDIMLVLSEIRRVLRNHGVFINESAITTCEHDQIFLADIHALVRKNMAMSTHQQLLRLYEDSGLCIVGFAESNFKLKSFFQIFYIDIIVLKKSDEKHYQF